MGVYGRPNMQVWSESRLIQFEDIMMRGFFDLKELDFNGILKEIVILEISI